MAKKKILNEAQVRRFMSLSGLQPLKEMYGSKMEEEEMEENIYEEETPAMEEAEPEMDDAPEMDAEPEMDDMPAEDTKEISQDMIDAASEGAMAISSLLSALSGEAAPEAEMDMDDMPAEEPALDMDEEELMENELEEVNLELNEDEIVQEVAKRVAKRILKAKNAQKQLDEALGNK
jgi:hypothetical protein